MPIPIALTLSVTRPTAENSAPSPSCSIRTRSREPLGSGQLVFTKHPSALKSRVIATCSCRERIGWPLQAAYVFKALVELKLVSPDFQVPPAVWDQTYDSLMDGLERAQASRKRAEQLRQQGAQSHGNATLTLGPPVGTLRGEVRPRETKYRELYDILAKRITFLTPGDGFEILDRMFTTLGI